MESTYLSDFPTKVHAKRPRMQKTLASASLGDLPEELIMIILEATTRHELFKRSKDYHDTVHSLCLTNRKFYRLASPYLYSCIDNRYADSGKVLELLVKQPQLRKDVNIVYWLDNKIFSDYTWDTRVPYKLSKIERCELHKIIHSTALEDHDIRALRRAIRRQSPDDLLSTLLLLSPNLRALYVEDSNECMGWHTPLWLRILTLGSCGSLEQIQNFQYLSHIVVRMGPIPLEIVVPLLHLPTLRKLEITHALQIGPMAEFQQERDWGAARSSSLKSLMIKNSSIDTDAICPMLGMIKGLEDFQFEWKVESSGFEGDREQVSLNFSYHSLRKALDHHSSTLESLCIVNHDSADLVDEIDSRGNRNLLGSLRDMHQIRKLDISLRAFRDTTVDHHTNLCDILPPSTEYLRLHIEHFDVLPTQFQTRWWICSLRDLVMDCRKSYPYLKTIVMYEGPTKANLIEYTVKNLRRSFIEQGISFVMEGEEQDGGGAIV